MIIVIVCVEVTKNLVVNMTFDFDRSSIRRLFVMHDLYLPFSVLLLPSFRDCGVGTVGEIQPPAPSHNNLQCL